jgi:hypothetical protein
MVSQPEAEYRRRHNATKTVEEFSGEEAMKKFEASPNLSHWRRWRAADSEASTSPGASPCSKKVGQGKQSAETSDIRADKGGSTVYDEEGGAGVLGAETGEVEIVFLEDEESGTRVETTETSLGPENLREKKSLKSCSEKYAKSPPQPPGPLKTDKVPAISILSFYQEKEPNIRVETTEISIECKELREEKLLPSCTIMHAEKYLPQSSCLSETVEDQVLFKGKAFYKKRASFIRVETQKMDPESGKAHDKTSLTSCTKTPAENTSRQPSDALKKDEVLVVGRGPETSYEEHDEDSGGVPLPVGIKSLYEEMRERRAAKGREQREEEVVKKE